MDNMKALENLRFSGDIAESWKKLEQNIKLLRIASGATEKDKSVQCAILLHMIGKQSLDVYNAFTFSQDKADKMLRLKFKILIRILPQGKILHTQDTCSTLAYQMDAHLTVS